MKLHRIFCLLWMALFFNKVEAQDPTQLPRITPPSPEAQQFHRFGDYPVGHYTGVPQIDIPLYTIKEGDMLLPVSLSYHASGLRVKDHYGIAGYGWTLMAGGRISRTIMGKNDFTNIFPYPFYTQAQLDANTTDYNVSYLGANVGGCASASGNSNSEYDIFSYDISSGSGKFVLDGSQPRVFPYKPISITTWSPSAFTDAQYFDIKDETGTHYRFGQSIDGLRLGQENIGGSDITSWLITDIQSPTDPSNNIKFSYNNNHYLSTCYNTSYTYSYNDNYMIDDYLNTTAPAWNSTNPTQTNSRYDYTIDVPQQITFKSGKITFTYNTTTKLLSQIELYDYNNNKIKSFHFNYTSRFLLSSIEFWDKNDQKVNQYTFHYHSEDLDFPRNSNAIDFWGFYNGRANSTLLHDWDDYALYYASQSYHVGNANRWADEESMKRHTLESIIYPTSGRTDFEYEGNKFLDGSNVIVGGGLRIVSIKNYDENGTLSETKTYKYNESAGIDNGTGLMPIIPRSELYRYTQSGITYETQHGYINSFRKRIFLEAPNVDLAPLGSPVVYDNVTEYLGDATGNIGKTIYYYSIPNPKNIANGRYEGIHYDTYYNLHVGTTFPPSGVSIDYKQYMKYEMYWNGGQPTGKNVYDKNGTLVESETNTYFPDNIRYTLRGLHAYKYTFFNSCNFYNGAFPDEYFCGTPGQIFVGQAANYADYYIITGDKKLASTTIFKDGVTTTTTYSYDNSTHIQPTQKITTNSKDETYTTYLKYPHDFVSEPNSPYANMVNNLHIWAPIIEQSVYKGSTPIQSYKTNYASWPNNIIAPITVESKKGSDTYEVRLRYNQYDDQGHVLSISKENDIPVQYTWGYNNTLITSIIQGAKSSHYNYQPLVGMTAKIDENGVQTLYEYDDFGRLLNIKDKDHNILKHFEYHFKQ